MSASKPQDLRIYRFQNFGLDPIAVYVEQYSERASREKDQARYLGRIIDAIQRHFSAIANKEAAHA